jgi:type IV pilus assembly protein PilC
VSQLVVRSSVARVCRTLGTLMDSGVSVLQALQIARETSGNEVVARAMQKVHDAVKEGEGMTKPMESARVFPPIVVSMVEVGEETGALPDMLNRIADVYEEEVDRAVDALTSMLEPAMIVMLAGIVGTIVISMFLPLIKLIEKLGGG